MKVPCQLNHPAHFHLFKNTLRILEERGHEVLITSRNKDVLEDLLKDIKHTTLRSGRGKTLREKVKQYNLKTKELLDIVDKFKPDLMIGTAAELSYVTRKRGIPSFLFVEDDVNSTFLIFVVALTCYPFFTKIVSPEICYNSIWEGKTIKYNSFQKLAYLHPNQFTPDKALIAKYIPVDKPFYLIRLSELNAYHDIGVKGLSTEMLTTLINKLQRHGNVYMTAEGKLAPEFEHLKIKIDPRDMHHFLALADMYIGDSQSMAVEAAVLGTPSIRFNGHVGKAKVSVLEELEHKYKLSTGIHSSNPEALYKKVDEFLTTPNIREEFQAKRAKMLEEKIDVTAFMVWMLENYPQSKKILKENPAYQYNFR